MSLPPLLVGAAVLFWGWQGGNLPVAVPTKNSVQMSEMRA